MMNESGFRRVPPDQSLGSGHTFGSPRHPNINDPILSKRVCFYKSGDPQFNGLRMVVNNRTFKTFDALLDSLSKKVPLPFGVRNITTPRGIHAVHTLDELEDGKSYICSDSRKVKPINLALARKKLAPWYHARPVSSRRRTVQQARLFHKQEPVLVRTPKILVVYRNGDPAVKHSVVLHKRTTPSFESILGYISELLEFHVVKLYTADGRRVDGLPGLILSSGTVVAVGREPFRPANYNSKKSTPPITSIKRMGQRRLRTLKSKKKSQSHTSKSRSFSPSSERYIVNRIHNSIAESSYLPSRSVELEPGHALESVPETPESCLGVGAGEQDSFLPTDDDIEKSFRVNQDGTMTVEMRVRLTIKEEETIHWTTTLARSSVANQLNVTGLPETEKISSLQSNSLDLQSPDASFDKDKTRDNNDEDPPSLGSRAFSDSGNEEDDIKGQTGVASVRRLPTPGHKQIRKKQVSVESVKSVTAEGVQEDMVGSYSYREQMEIEAMTGHYCMVKQSSSRPVPKPRRLGSVDANNISSRNVSTFKSAGMNEILQTESSGEEVTETVLHVYEQQTCQDNFFANLCSRRISDSGSSFCRPATSATGPLSSNHEFEPQLWRPSTASESISIWRGESTSASDLTSPSSWTGASQAKNAQQRFPKPTKEKRVVNKDKRGSSKPKVINKRVHRLMSPGKRRKENSDRAAEKSKKVKTFSSAGFIKKMYGTKSKPAKSMMKLKKGQTQNGDGGVSTEDDRIKCILKDPNGPSPSKETTSRTVSFENSGLNVAPNEVSQPRGILTRQTSMHQEKKNEHEPYDVSKSMSLPAFNSSSSVTNEYVEDWLEKVHLNPEAFPHEESKESETLVQIETGRCGQPENTKGLMIVADERKQSLKTDLLPPNEPGASVKQRIMSFENKASPSVVKNTVNQQATNIENHSSVSQMNEDNRKPSNHNCSEIIPAINESTETEMPSGSEVENKPSPIKISFLKETPSNTLSMELPSPPPSPPPAENTELLPPPSPPPAENTELLPPPSPPPAENTELPDTEHHMICASAVASSIVYRLSSASSHMSDNHTLSVSPTSNPPVSPSDHTLEMTTSIPADIPSTPREAPLPRTPSIKRAPLVSNTSLDRKMSLRKARLDKYASCSDAISETGASSTPVNTASDNVLPSGICSTGTRRPPENLPEEAPQSNSNLISSPSHCTSASPASLTSEERMSPVSISSSEAPTQNNTTFLTGKEAPTPSGKNVKFTFSPTQERKSQTKKLSSELPHHSPKLSTLHNRPPDKTSPSNTRIRRQATPNASPSFERKLHRPKTQKRLSPYSQSLDMVSPPVGHKSRMLSRNLTSDNASEMTNKTQRAKSSQRQRQKTPQSIKSTSEPAKTLSCDALTPLDTDHSDDSKASGDLVTSDQEKSTTKIRPLNTANEPNMKPVLEKICYSIKSIRQITQNKRRLCLEKSNSLPDFSSHVASTFGSSSKALLAFLSVMTLKKGLTDFNMDELNANNVSCAEALKMIDSLREIASIEDSDKLKTSLSDLQQSASKQLLQSWKGFQDLGDKCKSRSSTPNDLEEEVATEEDSPEKDDKVIDEIVDNLDIPEKLKEELTSLSVCVKSDSSGEGQIEKVEPEDKSNAATSHFSTGDAVNVSDVAKEEKTDVDVSSIIKKFTDINQPKQSSAVSITKDKDGLYGQDDVGTCPPAEPVERQKAKEMELYSQMSFDKDNGEQAKNEEKTQMSSKKSLEHDSNSSEAEEQDEEGNQLQMHSEEVVPDEELTYEESGSDEEGQEMSCTAKDLEQKVSCVTSSGAVHSSEEEAEVECEESRGSEDSSNPESHSEDEEDKQPNDKAEPNVRGKESSPDMQTSSSSEEEVECHAGSMYESTCNSGADNPSTEEEQPDIECKKLKVIIEESLSGNEEEEEECPNDLQDHREQTKKCRELVALMEETEEDTVSSDDEDRHFDKTPLCEKTKSLNMDLSNVIEKQDSYTTTDDSLIKSESLTKSCGFNADEDSGNDHSSCEEHVEQPNVDVERIHSSSYDDKESSSEEEHATLDRYIGAYQEAPALATQPTDAKSEKAAEKLKHQSEEPTSQSVAERVILLEKQVANAHKTTESPAFRRPSQRNNPVESGAEELPSDPPAPQSAPGTQSAPQSSLSFSYDSSGVIAEPEGNRVRSIRDMFLAKSATDIQHGRGRFPSPHMSERSELRTETSVSGGYQSQTSSELSGSEDDSARKSITKGFVRRTIERLYGKKDAKPEEEVCERPPSAPKQNKKEHTSIFSPFHMARSKAVSELSYFNSTNALDTLSQATRCIALNAQVGPVDRVPIDNEQWLLGENTLIRKSVSDPVGINKSFTNSPEGEGKCEDTEENAPYSLFSSKSELEDKKSSFSRKCTYFSLPHASDSDACQDDPSPLSTLDTKEDSEDAKAERNGMLPGVTDFKMKDNKVHPLIEPPPDGEVIAVQPRKGQGVMRVQEPDVLDILYNFCGQNCPIL